MGSESKDCQEGKKDSNKKIKGIERQKKKKKREKKEIIYAD